MKFNKHSWGRNEDLPVVTKEMVESKTKLFYPNSVLEHFEVVSNGLANLNICFKLSGTKDLFLLRIYNRNNKVLDLEVLLSTKLGQSIRMPEFLHIQKQNLPEKSFAIQKWIDGVPFFKILENRSEVDLIDTVRNIASVLSVISKQKFKKSGFFKSNFEIESYGENNQHPFISYIEDCLFKEAAGFNLGEDLKNKLWAYVIKNKDFFPVQEPACLVHGDFNFDNILIDPISNKVVALLDWEFAFSGSYLFDIGTFLRFEMPAKVKEEFIRSYETNSNIKLPNDFEKMIKVQDLANFVGLVNHPKTNPVRVHNVKLLIQETFERYP